MSDPGAAGTARPATTRSGGPIDRSADPVHLPELAPRAAPTPEAPRPTARPVRTAVSSLQNLSKLAYLWQIRRGLAIRLASGNGLLREAFEASDRGADEVVRCRSPRRQADRDRTLHRQPAAGDHLGLCSHGAVPNL